MAVAAVVAEDTPVVEGPEVAEAPGVVAVMEAAPAVRLAVRTAAQAARPAALEAGL